MLGHSKIQSDISKVIRIFGKTVTSEDEVNNILITYLSKDLSIISLYKVFRKNMLRFIEIFGGVVIDFPGESATEEDVKYSHLPEISRLFGKKAVSDLFDEFSGQRITPPTVDCMVDILRDVDIYCRVKKCQSKEDRKRTTKFLSNYYRIQVSEVNFSYRRVKKELEAK